jgi:hypothetical protein
MIDAKDAVVWVNKDRCEVVILRRGEQPWKRIPWCDPIGANYAQWRDMKKSQRVQLMLETAIDLAMQGVPLERVLKAFATVGEFRELGRDSYPMCRAMTSAMIGKCLEAPERFEELVTQ